MKFSIYDPSADSAYSEIPLLYGKIYFESGIEYVKITFGNY